MPSAWKYQDENPATYTMVRMVHDMSDEEFCEFYQTVKRACECGEDQVQGVPTSEAHNLAVSDAEYRHRLRGVNFPI